MILDDFERVRRGRPCPVCEKTTWCLVARDRSGAICKRVVSPKPRADAGHYHAVGDARGERVAIVPKPAARKLTPEQVTQLKGRFAAGMDAVRLARVASGLSLSPGSIERLGIGFDGEAYTFPMEDGHGAIVGFRRRFDDGRKLSVRGGREGIFVPTRLGPIAALHLCEGPTSCAALLTLGFHAVGRPSCSGGVRQLREWLAERPGLDVIVWGDRDAPKPLPGGKTFRPGQDGALACAKAIWCHCRSIRVFVPTAAKDARDWLRAGASATEVRDAIGRTAWFKPPRVRSGAALARRNNAVAGKACDLSAARNVSAVGSGPRLAARSDPRGDGRNAMSAGMAGENARALSAEIAR